jgi:3'-phosphoadenosine 5'-phosphosulfate sulfotransferase (PAPS reductase)/FAD synthetase
VIIPEMSVSDLAQEAKEIISRAKEHFRPKTTFALFSGGNDSTTMMHLVHKEVDAAVHIRTGIGIESTFQHVQDVCAALKKKLIVLQTDPSVYRTLVLRGKYKARDGSIKVGKGFPGPALHYICYHHLKQHRVRDLQRDYSIRGEKLLLISGVRRKESKRRAKSVEKKEWSGPDHEARRCVWANPLINCDSRDMCLLREELSVPQCEAAALIHKSGECLCGAFAKPGELEEIEFWFPEVGKQIRDLEKEAERAGKPYCKWGHGKIEGEVQPVGPLCQGCQLF